MMKKEMERQEAMAKEKDEKRKEIKLLFNSKTEQDARRYNLPVTNEVAAIFVPTEDGNVPQASIILHEKGKQITKLQHIDPLVEGVLYPLFKPRGKKGWNVSWKTNSGKNLSQCDFIIFNLQYRKRQESKDG